MYYVLNDKVDLNTQKTYLKHLVLLQALIQAIWNYSTSCAVHCMTSCCWAVAGIWFSLSAKGKMLSRPSNYRSSSYGELTRPGIDCFQFEVWQSFRYGSDFACLLCRRTIPGHLCRDCIELGNRTAANIRFAFRGINQDLLMDMQDHLLVLLLVSMWELEQPDINRTPTSCHHL